MCCSTSSYVREAVEEKLREGKEGGLQRGDSHEGFLWADLGGWCLDKAPDFPAWNVHSPRETANHRKGVREKEGETDRQTEGRKEEKATEVETENKKTNGRRKK